jgi:hypothetical protein
MTDPSPVNGNGCRKAQNRRAKFTSVALVLVTVAFYICLFKGTDIEWFIEYGKLVILLLFFIVGGISATDGIRSWKNNSNGEAK